MHIYIYICIYIYIYIYINMHRSSPKENNSTKRIITNKIKRMISSSNFKKIRPKETTLIYSFHFHFFLLFLLPFFICACWFYVQVLLKLILSSRISRLNIIHHFGSIVLYGVSLHLRYSGLRMGYILVAITPSTFVRQGWRTLANTHAVQRTAKEARN